MTTPCFGFKKVLLVLLWGLAMLLPAATPLPSHRFHGPDYRVGLHTHQGYPADMAAALDVELAKWRNTRAGWAEADLPRLIEHANQFQAPLIVHGGISWSIIQQSLQPTVVTQAPLRVHFAAAAPAPGEFLFHGDTLYEVGELDPEQATWSLHRLQGDHDLASGETLTRYRAVLHADAATSLRRLDCARLIVQLVLLPRADDPLPAVLFGAASGGHRLALDTRQKNTATEFFNMARFQAPLLAEGGHGKALDARTRFVQTLYAQVVDQISAAARDDRGHSKIAYWLLGNEPDVLIPVTPTRYLDWLLAFDQILQSRQAPGELLLTNVSGLGFECDTWLAQLEQAMVAALADGRLNPARRPFHAAAITHYLNPENLDTKHLGNMTARFTQRIRALDALFDDPRPSRLIAKEIAFQGQSEVTAQLLAETAPGELQPGAKQRLRGYVTALKQMGYDDLVWFNQMPTGFGHGKLIHGVSDVRETGLGRYLRQLNQSFGDAAQAPIQATLTPSERGLAFRLAFQPTFHAYTALDYRLTLENAAGRKLAHSQGVLTRDNRLVQGLWTDLDLGDDYGDDVAADYRVVLQYSAPEETEAAFFQVFRPASLTPLATASFKQQSRRKDDVVSIPDDAFRQFLLAEYDLDQDGVLTVGEAALPTLANWDLPYVTDLTGLEAFTALDFVSLRIAPDPNGALAEITMPTLVAPNLTDLRLRGIRLAETWVAPASLETFGFTTKGNLGRLDMSACAKLAILVVDDQSNTTPVPLFSDVGLFYLSLAGVVVDQPSYLRSVRVDYDAEFLRCAFPADADLGFFRVAGKLKFQQCQMDRVRGRFRDLNELRFARNGLNAAQLSRFLSENDLAQLPFLSVINEPLDLWPLLDGVQGLTRLELINCGLATPEYPESQPNFPPQLRHLSLEGNRMTRLFYTPMLELKTLDVSSNDLTSTANLRVFPAIELLDVSNNPRLREMIELGFMSRLEYLNIRRCSFYRFPDIFLVPTLRTFYGSSNPLVRQCRDAAFYLNDRTRWYATQVGTRLPGTTDLLCDPDDEIAPPVFGEQFLRSVNATAQGDQILLRWQGGARRNFQVEQFVLESNAAWRPVAVDPFQNQFGLELLDDAGEFVLSSRTPLVEGPRIFDYIDQAALSLTKSSARWRYPLPHVPVDQGWSVTLNFTNQSSQPASVQALAVSPAGETSLLRTIALAGAEQSRIGLDVLLGSVAREAAPWVLFVSDQPLTVEQTIVRAELQEQVSRQMLAPAHATEGFIYLPEKTHRYFRALVFTNTNLDLAVQIRLRRYRDDETLEYADTLNLAPGEKWVGLAEDLVSLDYHDAMLRWEADIPIVDFAIYGTVAPFTMLSADNQTNRAATRGTLAGTDFAEDVTVINTVDFPAVVRFYHDDVPGRQRIIHLPAFGVQRIPRDWFFLDALDAPIHYEADAPVRVSRVRTRESSRREPKRATWSP